MSKCVKCGAELSGTGRFCSECGASQKEPSNEPDIRLSGISLTGDSLSLTLNIPPGEILNNDRFVIENRINSGGFGEVYLAMDNEANYQVALKIVPTQKGQEKIAAEQLRNEINYRRRINDFSHIIRVNEIFVDDYKGLPLVLLSMEYADGGSLREWIKENIGSIKQNAQYQQAIRHFKEACRGVKVIHDAGLVHLDLKPENLLFSERKIKVSDLGLTRHYIQYAQNRDVILWEMGTPTYMSPEQFKTARQKEINYLSDIYTLGVILFELLDGHPPFDGKFEDLKAKHLEYNPPHLDSHLAAWDRIVNRCLSKNPSKRYSSIDKLISDVDRAELGYTLSIDVSCKKCGHINVNKDLKKCENCQEAITDLFLRCPNCQRWNRLDQEVCPLDNISIPGCGFKVGRHFRILNLMQEANELKDVDPEEAILRWVEVLRLEGGNSEVKENLAGLRKIQEQIETIIPEAEKAEIEGRLEEARENWHDVLAIAPRHKVATEKKQLLDQLIKKYNTNYEQVIHLLDKGRFIQARKLLEECRSLIPNRKEIDSAFEQLNEREKEYNGFLEEAKTKKRLKKLYSTRKLLMLCLEKAPNSNEVTDLIAEINKGIKVSEGLFNNSKQFLLRAQFEKAEKSIDEIREIRSDFRGIDSFFEQLREKKQKYERYAKKWENALMPGVRDLKLAENNIRRAFEICPHDKKTESVLKDVEIAKADAIDQIEKAKKDINSAFFDKAEKKLDKAFGIWTEAPALKKTRTDLEQRKISYEKYVDRAMYAIGKAMDLEAALNNVEAALKICPGSSKAKSLKSQIEQKQRKAKFFFEKAMSFILKADFRSSWCELKKAENIWATNPDFLQAREKIESIQNEYSKFIDGGKILFAEQKDLKAALGNIEAAIILCPKSSEANDLIKSIEEEQEKVVQLVKKANLFIESAKFELAIQSIHDAEVIWPDYFEIYQTKKSIQEIPPKYNGYINACQKLYEKKDFETALKRIRISLNLCPNSSEANKMRKSIIAEQEKAMNLIEQASSCIRAADIGKAKKYIKEAKNIWPEATGINNISEMLKITEQKYYFYINRANKIRGKRIFTIFVSSKRIHKALKQCEKALRICPNSKEANNLMEEINDLFVKKEIRWNKINKMFNRRKFKRRKEIDKTYSLKKITRKKKIDEALNYLAKLAEPNSKSYVKIYGYPSIYKDKRKYWKINKKEK